MVARWFEEREGGRVDNDSPLAWEEHNRRAAGLHDVLDDNPEWRVTDWGDTDDRTHTHEDIFVQVLHWISEARPALESVGSWAGLTAASAVLGKAVEAAAVDPVKRLIARLARKQHDGELARFVVTLPGGAKIFVDPGEHDKVQIQTEEDDRWGARVTVSIEAIAPPKQD